MCIYSAVMDYGNDWLRRQQPVTPGYPHPQPWVPAPGYPNQFPLVPPTLPDQIKAFEELLRKAKAFDDATGQPGCELDAKKKTLRELADQLGVKIKIE